MSKATVLRRLPRVPTSTTRFRLENPTFDPSNEQIARVSVGDEPANPDATIVSTSDAQVNLEGSVVITDGHGVEHAKESGSFNLELWTANSRTEVREVRFQEGRFSIAIRPCDEFGIEDLFCLHLNWRERPDRMPFSVEAQTLGP